MHYFLDFKCFREANINLFNPLTVLIGPNGSGKSNTIEAVELLSFLVHGGLLYEIGDIGSGNKLIVRGGLKACPRKYIDASKNINDAFMLGFNASIQFLEKSEVFDYSIAIATEPKPRIFLEKLSLVGNKERIIFETLPTKKQPTASDISVKYNNFARGGKNPITTISSNRSAISQYKEFAFQGNIQFKECVRIVTSIMHYLHSSFVFDPNPKLMRSYERIGNDILTRNGSNLSSVLYRLKHGTEKDQDTINRILNHIKQIPEEPYSDIDFVTTTLNDVILGFKNSERKSITDARLLSDGTLRSLAVLTALETVEEGSRVIIEEFDNGLHPSRLHILIEALSSCCKRRNLNVLVTTHNPATLNELNLDQLDCVVLSVWDETDQAFKFIKLNDLPRHDELLERGKLGDLVTKRIIEQYLSPEFEKEHKEKSLQWLQELK